MLWVSHLIILGVVGIDDTVFIDVILGEVILPSWCSHREAPFAWGAIDADA